jgi:hypothetical protein
VSDNETWEEVLDDSWQWHVAHRFTFWWIIATIGLALLADQHKILLTLLILVPLHVGLIARENHLLLKAKTLADEAKKRR